MLNNYHFNYYFVHIKYFIVFNFLFLSKEKKQNYFDLQSKNKASIKLFQEFNHPIIFSKFLKVTNWVCPFTFLFSPGNFFQMFAISNNYFKWKENKSSSWFSLSNLGITHYLHRIVYLYLHFNDWIYIDFSITMLITQKSSNC